MNTLLAAMLMLQKAFKIHNRLDLLHQLPFPTQAFWEAQRWDQVTSSDLKWPTDTKGKSAKGGYLKFIIIYRIKEGKWCTVAIPPFSASI